jgi:hypothetical protein
MAQPDDPGPCTDEASERVASQAETLESRVSIVRAVRAYYPAWPVPTAAAPQPVPGGLVIIGPQPHQLPTAAELTDNATYAAMLEVMRQAEALRRAAWVRPCCAVCGQPATTPALVDGVAYHPACSSCALERAFGA